MVTPDVLERGLWGVLATPFTDQSGPIDFSSLERQVALHQRAGSVGVVALGVFGEAARLSMDEQASVVRFVSHLLPGQRIVVGLSSLTTEGVVSAARELAEVSARPPALMVQINDCDPDIVVEHLSSVADRTGLGIVMQDYPVASGIQIGSAEVARIAQACAGVIAVKCEAPPTTLAIDTITAAVNIPVFGGLGGLGLLDELAVGSAGAMTGFSFPEALARVVSAYRSEGYVAARQEYLPWLPLVNFEAQAAIGLAIRKASLQLRGVFDNGAVRRPGLSMTDAMRRILHQHHDALPSL